MAVACPNSPVPSPSTLRCRVGLLAARGMTRFHVPGAGSRFRNRTRSPAWMPKPTSLLPALLIGFRRLGLRLRLRLRLVRQWRQLGSLRLLRTLTRGRNRLAALALGPARPGNTRLRAARHLDSARPGNARLPAARLANAHVRRAQTFPLVIMLATHPNAD